MPDMNNLTEHEEQALEHRMHVLDDMKPSAEERDRRIEQLRAMAVDNICGDNELIHALDAQINKLTALPKVVAFTGLRMAGKSTAAKVLIEKHDYVDVKFADPLKNMLRALYRTCGLDDEEIERRLEGDLKEVPCKFLLGKTPRFAMQTLGTEWRDFMGPNMWSDITKMRIENRSCGKRIVVSDYRFKHEAATLDELGALKIRIIGSNVIVDEAAKHVSETTILEVPQDVIIWNDGTIKQLQECVLEAVEEWGGV